MDAGVGKYDVDTAKLRPCSLEYRQDIIPLRNIALTEYYTSRYSKYQ